VNLRAVFRPSVRLRLTLLYTGLVLALGALLLVANYFLVRRNLTVEPSVLRQRIELRLGHSLFTFQAPPLAEYRRLEQLLREAAQNLRAEALHALIYQSIAVFGALAAASLGLGWLLTGKVLKRLTTITGAARRLSQDTLNERIDLQGPKDELKELADTFDEMLARLDVAFESQRRFVANASHELQTPLSVIRTELDVTLSNPDANVEELQAMAGVVRQATDRSERLIESLLTLARSEGVPIRGGEVELSSVVAGAVARFEKAASERKITVDTSLEPANVRGDEVLLERLVENLMENAVRHNRPGGWIRVWTVAEGSMFRFGVRSSGEAIPDADILTLFEPFRRLGPDRVRSNRGVGLGLAIVRAVARAHGGVVTASGVEGGGLEVLVGLPAVTARAPVPSQ
jgi:signal transduction histidine kinase